MSESLKNLPENKTKRTLKVESELKNGTFRGIYSCHYCGKDLFSTNYQIDSPSDLNQDILSFSESLCYLSLLSARLDNQIYKEVYCSVCNTKLGFLFIDSEQISKKRFHIPASSLVFRENQLNQPSLKS